jgi:hypothetical protein
MICWFNILAKYIYRIVILRRLPYAFVEVFAIHTLQLQ